jgi:endonuclease YncB( thermonuclease family)
MMQWIYQATLERVVDGDTVDIVIDLGFSTFRKERVRLYGVDAPEINTEAGKLAKGFVEEWFWDNPKFFIETIVADGKSVSKRDKYGRYLGFISNDNADLVARASTSEIFWYTLNGQLVKSGHAKARVW